MSTNTETTPAQSGKGYDNDMRGVLYKNDKKTEDKHPNAKGRMCIDGVWYWLSAWTQYGRTNGERYQSIAATKMTDEDVEKYINKTTQQAAQPKASGQQASQQGQPPMTGANNVPEFVDDEIPF